MISKDRKHTIKNHITDSKISLLSVVMERVLIDKCLMFSRHSLCFQAYDVRSVIFMSLL